VTCEAYQREVRERLCRYIARPAVAEQRLTVSATGKVVYLLKTPYRDGTTHIVFEPLDFIARLAALVPRPRVNLTRYHGDRGKTVHGMQTWRAARRGEERSSSTISRRTLHPVSQPLSICCVHFSAPCRLPK
jgi:hypothetical protein